MGKPSNHPKEAERLQALKDLSILDTVAEKEFDEITLIASLICDAPIALISLVDDKRQWFKSKVGLSVSETPRELAFCSHAILQDDVFVIPDSRKDNRFSDNPLVTGEPHVLFYAGAPLLDPNSHLPIGTICVIDHKPRTITEKQMKGLKALSGQITKLLDLRLKLASLKRINEKMEFQKTAFESMSEGVVLQEKGGRIIDYNLASLDILELSADQLSGKSSLDPDWQAIHENGSNYPGAEHPAMMALSTSKPQKNNIMGIRSKKQRTKWLSITSTPLFLKETDVASHAVTTFSDITEQRNSQQTIFHSAKMISLGEMAGGVAHEINTPLAIISLAIEQINSSLENSNPNIETVRQKLKKIDETVGRIARIVKGLRTFSRDSKSDKWEYSSIKKIILDTIALCSEKFSAHGISLTFDCGEDYLVHCEPTQVSQVILNLLSNAFDAAQDSKEKWVKISAGEQADSIVVKVVDSGKGIKDEDKEKIMQPFFTTKEVGKGTGLGLSISKGIIESFKGSFFLEDGAKNTCFVVRLPKGAAEKNG